MANMEETDKDEQLMAAYLVHKHSFIKNELLRPLKVVYGQDYAEESARDILLTELALHLPVNPDAVMQFLVTKVNLQSFFE